MQTRAALYVLLYSLLRLRYQCPVFNAECRPAQAIALSENRRSQPRNYQTLCHDWGLALTISGPKNAGYGASFLRGS